MTVSGCTPRPATAGRTEGEGPGRPGLTGEPSTSAAGPDRAEAEAFVTDWMLWDRPPCDPEPPALADAA